MHADIELDPDRPVGRERPARFPWGVLVAVVLLVAVLYMRQPVSAAASSTDSNSAPPPATSMAVSAGTVESFSVDTDAHAFTMSFFLTTSSTWPISMTGVRLALPVGLSQTVPPRLVTASSPGRLLPSATVAVQLTARAPVLVVVGLSVRCDQLYQATLGRVRVLTAVNVAGRVSELDVAARYVMNGWPWSAALAGQACNQQLGAPPIRSNRMFGSDPFGGSMPLGVFGQWGGSEPLAGSNSGSVSGTIRRR